MPNEQERPDREATREAFVEWMQDEEGLAQKTAREYGSVLSGERERYKPWLGRLFPGMHGAFECNSPDAAREAHGLALQVSGEVNDHNTRSAAVGKYAEYLGRGDTRAAPEAPGDETGGSATTEGGYSLADFLSDVYMDGDRASKLLRLLRRKRNVVLQGAPGTGKTYAARRLCYLAMGEVDDSRVTLVQFSQNTTYDDFVFGYRPTEMGTFEPAYGTFVEVCDAARSDPLRDHFLLVDEINRANVSKVLGELLMLIEADKRGVEVTLTASGGTFSVPANLYIIGMMNTADRGLALIDYALRRRFAFFEMEPAFSHPAFLARLAASGDPGLARLAGAVSGLNARIARDYPSLGPGFRIGHSYFCLDDARPGDAESIYEFEIGPLIDEYWFDDTRTAGLERSRLEEALR